MGRPTDGGPLEADVACVGGVVARLGVEADDDAEFIFSEAADEVCDRVQLPAVRVAPPACSPKSQLAPLPKMTSRDTIGRFFFSGCDAQYLAAAGNRV